MKKDSIHIVPIYCIFLWFSLRPTFGLFISSQQCSTSSSKRTRPNNKSRLFASSSSSSSLPSSVDEVSDSIAVFGCGVLGTSLCKQLLQEDHNDDGSLISRTVVGITKTSNRHESILAEVFGTKNDDDSVDNSSSGRFTLKTADEMESYTSTTKEKFRDVVFCAPPSGFDDYPGAVEECITKLWAGPSEGGVFVFTSSGGIYGSNQNNEIITENSPTADPKTNPRSAKLLNAEKVVTENGGICLRLAGLYLLDRGAHNYWLKSAKEMNGHPDGIINLLHYDDAASSCIAAIKQGYDKVKDQKIFLISDGNPTTRIGICISAMKHPNYEDCTIPKFIYDEEETNPALGKVYDGTLSNNILDWKPKYNSFDNFMSS